jgi:hypothetical protein
MKVNENDGTKNEIKKISPYSVVVGEPVEASEGARMATMMVKNIMNKASEGKAISKQIDKKEYCVAEQLDTICYHQNTEFCQLCKRNHDDIKRILQEMGTPFK